MDEDGGTNLAFTFTRDLTVGALPINFSVAGTATVADSDYAASSGDAGFNFSGGTITFAASGRSCTTA